jgi:hypothetical protein
MMNTNMVQKGDYMNTTTQELFGTRGFRIAVIAVAAAIVLAAAAYLFGTGLRADTSASVAPSPLGSSLTNVRESLSEDYVDRLMNESTAARAASLAAAGSFADRYDRIDSSSAASEAALRTMIESRGSADYAARAAGLWFDIPAVGTMASQPVGSQSSVPEPSAATRATLAGLATSDFAMRYGIPAAAVPSMLDSLAQRWAPFYAGLDKALSDAGAR